MAMVQVDDSELRALRELKALVDSAPLFSAGQMHGDGGIIKDGDVFIQLGKDHEYAVQRVVVLRASDVGRS